MPRSLSVADVQVVRPRFSHEGGAKRDAQLMRAAQPVGSDHQRSRRSPPPPPRPAATTAAATTTTVTTAATTTTTSAGLAFLRDAHAERTAFEVRTVELGNRFLSVGIAAHRDERKAARTARLAVNHQLGFSDFTGLAERAQEHVFGGVKGKGYPRTIGCSLLTTLYCRALLRGRCYRGRFRRLRCRCKSTASHGRCWKRLSATLVPVTREQPRRLPNTLCGSPCSADHRTAQPSGQRYSAICRQNEPYALANCWFCLRIRVRSRKLAVFMRRSPCERGCVPGGRSAPTSQCSAAREHVAAQAFRAVTKSARTELSENAASARSPRRLGLKHARGLHVGDADQVIRRQAAPARDRDQRLVLAWPTRPASSR